MGIAGQGIFMGVGVDWQPFPQFDGRNEKYLQAFDGKYAYIYRNNKAEKFDLNGNIISSEVVPNPNADQDTLCVTYNKNGLAIVKATKGSFGYNDINIYIYDSELTLIASTNYTDIVSPTNVFAYNLGDKILLMAASGFGVEENIYRFLDFNFSEISTVMGNPVWDSVQECSIYDHRNDMLVFYYAQNPSLQGVIVDTKNGKVTPDGKSPALQITGVRTKSLLLHITPTENLVFS